MLQEEIFTKIQNIIFIFYQLYGCGNFDHDLMKTKNIKVKNFFAIGSIKPYF